MNTSILSFIHGLADSLLIVASLLITSWYFGQDWEYSWSFIAACGIGAFYFFAQSTALYRSWRIVPMRKELGHLWLVWFATGITIFIIAFFNDSFRGTHLILTTWLIITFITMSLWRIIFRLTLRKIRKDGYNTRTVAIVGRNQLGEKLSNTLQQASWMGLRLVGFYEDRHPTAGRTATDSAGTIHGNLDDLLDHARKGMIDLIYIALPLRAEARIRELVSKLADSTISVYIVPDFFTYDLLHSRWTTIGELPVISIYETPFYGIDGFIKRLEDLILGTIILGATIIPMCIIAIAIKLTSAGPALFKQRRGGVNGEEITVWKFRTMKVNEDDDNVTQATQEDPRVTPLGKLLRRLSLDELPQIFNVLQGSMSIVGPRPHALTHNAYYRRLIHRYMLRHKVKPGMTGWAQVNGWRGETDVLSKMEKRIEYDLEYIHNWSLLFDLKIIALTPFICLRNKNAY